MAVQTNNKIYDNLIDNLLELYVFYIPQEIINKELVSHIEEEEASNFFNVFHLIVNGSYGDLDINGFKKKQFEKSVNLDANLFELLGLEKNVSLAEFHYVVAKYLDILEFLLTISNWMKDNLKVYMESELDLDAYSVFGVQFNQLTKHFLEVYKIYGKAHEVALTESYSIEMIVNYYLPDLIARYIKFVEKVPFEIVKEGIIESTSTKHKKPKKKVLITEKEAENFLLETVFNIKINQ